MFFHQFYLGCLAHASYMLGSSGIAVVVDPQRDVEIYLQEASRQDLRIAHIIETHLHADFVSGHRELADRTGAQIYVGHAANAAFPHRAVREGDEIRFGRCVLSFLETPGHTVEGMCVLVTDLDRAAEPFAVLTGDTLFIGDVGRPDLSRDHTPQQLAAMLFRSLHGKLLTLPDSVEVFPAHGAGSLCGRNISAQRQSTIGEQKRTNYALKPMPEADFVRLLTSEFAARPGYFTEDAEINRTGAAALCELRPPQALAASQVEAMLGPGGQTLNAAKDAAVAIDVRRSEEFCSAHVPGSVNIGLSGQFASWAATIVGLQRPIILVAASAEQIAEARMRLTRVGIENVAGYLDGGVEAWAAGGSPLATTTQISVGELSQALALNTEIRFAGSSSTATGVQIVDVRRDPEWNSGHLPGAVHVPLDSLTLATPAAQPSPSAAFEALDRTRPVAVHCKSGYRSAIACGLLERLGFHAVMNVTGGFDAWQSAGLPITSGRADLVAVT